jgi:hypothetical protein
MMHGSHNIKLLLRVSGCACA